MFTVPEPPAERPSVEVATHRVEVPVVWSTFPLVPALLVTSKNLPSSLKEVLLKRGSVEVAEVLVAVNEEPLTT